ncbi:MAG: MFS transporter [Aquisalimonadaceae bacterium]
MPIILLATALTFATLYAPQPILPVLAAHHGLTASTTSLLITVTMVPMAVAPVLYGLWLEAASARRMVVIAAAGLGLTQLLFGLAPAFSILVAARGIAGLVIPAMLTALMTYLVATAPPGRMAQALGAYIAASVFGGYVGRLYSGLMAEWLGWRPGFLLLGLALLITAALLTRLAGDPRTRAEQITVSMATNVLRRPGVLAGYLMTIAVFFVFACVLNLLPFRMVALSADISATQVALMYTGYLVGLPVALGSVWLARRLGGQRVVVRTGLVLYLLGTLLFAVPSVPFTFMNMFLFAIGMFMVHGTTPALLNSLCPDHRGVVNGLYLSFYYTGGAIGSWLPGYLYRSFGWDVLMGVLGLLIVLAMFAARALPANPPAMVSGSSVGPAARK